MKTLKITLLCCLFTCIATAQNIITIDNSPESLTTYQTLQDAIDAAASGDIIYIQPTATNYGSGIVDKPLTLVGRSHSEVNRKSSVANITVQSSNVTVKGISFSSLLTDNNGPEALPRTGLKVFECQSASSVRIGLSVSTNEEPPTVSDVQIQGCVVY